MPDGPSGGERGAGERSAPVPRPSPVLDAPLLVVGQRPLTAGPVLEFPIRDGAGTRLGSLADVGRDDLRRALSPARVPERGADTGTGGLRDGLHRLSSIVREVPYRLEIRDGAGLAQVVLTGSGWQERSWVTVLRPDGREIGRIVKENRWGKARYALLVGAARVGRVVAEQYWTVGHRILDPHGEEVARVAPSPQGWLARARRAESESFVVRVHRRLDDPVRVLVAAAAVAADTALKQKEPVDGT
jgi:hypothetical protein